MKKLMFAPIVAVALILVFFAHTPHDCLNATALRASHYYGDYYVVEYRTRWWPLWRSVKEASSLGGDPMFLDRSFPLIFPSFEAAKDKAEELALPGRMKAFVEEQDRRYESFVKSVNAEKARRSRTQTIPMETK